MEASAVRLSNLDPHVEGAIRVVVFHDTLMRRRVDLAALARASAVFAECVAGIRIHGTGRSTRIAVDGTPASGPPAPASTTAPITLDEADPGPARPHRVATARPDAGPGRVSAGVIRPGRWDGR
ncbi:hypothetical protein ACFWBC_08060 [Streptomyces sp. NPDC059985]|uniref:hypothetical protein n=1 Tax=Streptomyces sp. NPDC059985 TaxID=3347025 RepID=UPI0036CAE970